MRLTPLLPALAAFSFLLIPCGITGCDRSSSVAARHTVGRALSLHRRACKEPG